MKNFEKSINEEKSNVNNLDLNEDGEIDYIRVIDHKDGDAHAIVLQVPINEKESQDIAVIEIERTDDNSAVLQIVGDEELYGMDHFVEPFEVEARSSEKGGPNADFAMVRIVVNVWAWPTVRYIYAPGYRVYVSPYRWGYYPRYWRPWRPLTFRVHYSRRHFPRVNCHVVTTHRVKTAHRVYVPKRRTSVTVKTRKVTVSKGNKSVTRTNTTVTKKQKRKGNTTVAKKRTTTTKVKKGNKTVAKKKKTKKVKKRKG